VGKTELVRRFGVSWRAVYHWIETGQMERELDADAMRYCARPQVANGHH
jgi:transposase